MQLKYCSIPGRKIEPSECGSFEGCPELGKCELRSFYGWNEQPAGTSSTTHKCNMCHKPLDIINFEQRKDGKGRKKTCRECEDKYITRTAELKGGQKKQKSPKKTKTLKQKPQQKPEAPPEKPIIDLSKVTWLQNHQKNTDTPGVRFNQKEISFNAAARQKFADLIKNVETVDIGIREDSKQIVFRLHNEMSGEYRVGRGKNGRPEFKVCITLDKKGLRFSKGPWPVQEVDGMLVVEVE